METDISRYLAITGAVRESGDGIALCIDESDAENRVSYAHVMVWGEGRWRLAATVDWQAVSACPAGDGWIVLGARGEALNVQGAVCTEEHLGEPGDAEPISGMACVRNIAGRVYAAGMLRRVYARVGDGRWTRQDDGVRRTSVAEGVVGFQAIAGFGPEELYGCGWRGEIWARFKGDWHRVESPTNLILTDLCCGADGLAYAVGQRGTVVRGRGAEWHVVEHDGAREDFWGVAWHEGKLFVSSLISVHELDGEHLTRVDMGEASAMSCYHLSAAGPWLWSVGLRNICARYGTGEWRRLR